jgi:hypothetical protein
LEFEQNGSLEQTNLLSSQAVTFLRSKNLDEMFNPGKDTKLIVYQPGPLSIQIELESTHLDKLKVSHKQVMDFTYDKYRVKNVGEDVYQTLKPNVYFGTVSGFLIGGFIGVILVLIRTYLKNF